MQISWDWVFRGNREVVLAKVKIKKIQMMRIMISTKDKDQVCRKSFSNKGDIACNSCFCKQEAIFLKAALKKE